MEEVVATNMVVVVVAVAIMVGVEAAAVTKKSAQYNL